LSSKRFLAAKLLTSALHVGRRVASTSRCFDKSARVLVFMQSRTTSSWSTTPAGSGTSVSAERRTRTRGRPQGESGARRQRAGSWQACDLPWVGRATASPIRIMRSIAAGRDWSDLARNRKRPSIGARGSGADARTDAASVPPSENPQHWGGRSGLRRASMLGGSGSTMQYVVVGPEPVSAVAPHGWQTA
jgi:hypothetical protein